MAKWLKLFPLTTVWSRTDFSPLQLNPNVGMYESQIVQDRETGKYSQVFYSVGNPDRALSWHGVVTEIARHERTSVSDVLIRPGLMNAYISGDWRQQQRDIDSLSPPSVDSSSPSHNFLTPTPMTQQSPPPQALDDDNDPEQELPAHQPSLSKEEWKDLDLRQVEEHSNDPPESQIPAAAELLWSQEPPQESSAAQKPSLVSEEELSDRTFHDQVELERVIAEKRSLDFVNKLANADPKEHELLCALEMSDLEDYFGREYAVYMVQDYYRKDLLQVAACEWLDPDVLKHFRFDIFDGEYESRRIGDTMNQERLMAVIDDSLKQGNISETDYDEIDTKLLELLDEQFQEPSSTAPELPEQEIYKQQQQHRPLGEAMLGQLAQEQLREEYLNNLSLPEHEIGGFNL
jgi:hypothetical protein